MKKHNSSVLSFGKQSVSLALAFAMVLNLGGEAFAQAVSAVEFQNARSKRELLQLKDLERSFVSESTGVNNQAIRIQARLNQEHMEHPAVRRATELRKLFISDPLTDLIPQNSANSFQTFSQQYIDFVQRNVTQSNAKLTAELTSARKEIANQAAAYLTQGASQTEVAAWRGEAEQALEAEYQKSVAQVQAWKTDSLKMMKQVYETQQANGAKELEDALKRAARELMDLYQQHPARVGSVVLEVSPVALMLRKEGLDVFSDKDKDALRKFYTQILVKGKSCLEPTARNASGCNAEISALVGLGILGQDREEAVVVSEFMQRHMTAPSAAAVILAGASSLLAMKQYDVLRGFIISALDKETSLENLDLLSTGYIVEGLKNMNGQYLGEASKYAQYPLAGQDAQGKANGNAWEDLALMLAEEGSAKSLAILKEFGVDKCFVSEWAGVNLKKQHKMVCATIQPFLAGALISGKSGVAQYLPNVGMTSPGATLDANGRGGYITAEQAQTALQKQKGMVAAFHEFIKTSGLPEDAFIARQLFVKSMGDLDADTEQALDSRLANFFTAKTKGVAVKPEWKIEAYAKGSAEYNAKAVRQDRAQIWTKISHVADFAILVWCAYDLFKLGAKGVAMGRSIAKSVSMARAGASTMQRGLMLRRLNTVKTFRAFRNVPGRIANGMKPLVLEQTPLFAYRAPEITFGSIRPAGEVLVKQVRFSSETGLLATQTERVLERAPSLTGEKVAVFNTVLAEASSRANKIFANQSGWLAWKNGTDAAGYRRVLAGEVQKSLAALKMPASAAPAMTDFVAGLKTNVAITIPQNIASFKNPSLMLEGFTTNLSGVRSLGAYALGAGAQQHMTVVEQAFASAVTQANRRFAQRSSLMQKSSQVLGKDDAIYRGILSNEFVSAIDRFNTLQPSQQLKLSTVFGEAIRADKSITAPKHLSAFHVVPNTEKVTYQKMGASFLSESDPLVQPQQLPLNILMDKGVRGVDKSGAYQRMVFTDVKKDDMVSYLLGVSNGSTKLNLSNFKITVPSKEMPKLITAAETAGVHTLDNPFMLKLVPLKRRGWFGKASPELDIPIDANRIVPFRVTPRTKDQIFIDPINVYRRSETGALNQLPVRLNADYLLGLRNSKMVLERDGSLQLYSQAGEALKDHKLFSYGLRKNDLKPFVRVLQQGNLNSNLTLFVKGSRGKMAPLYVATGLSLSSASTSLIAPLENTYGDRITETDKVLISLALPYIPSLMAPMLTPIVMKIGALNTVRTALLTSTLGLGVAWGAGFSGKLDKNNLPQLWPLFVSGAAIGISSALSRSGLNLLIDSLGGGGGLLKSMAAKNIGSFALLAPPLLWSFMKNEPGASDFSLAFPVLTTLSAASLGSMFFSRIDPTIGMKKGFMAFKPLVGGVKGVTAASWANTAMATKEVFKESWSSVRILASREVLPLTAAAFAFTGFEAAAFSKASNQLIRPEVKDAPWVLERDKADRDNWVALITSGTVVMFPLLTRLAAKPMLGALANPLVEGAEYKRMLGLSFGLNAAGSALLMNYGFDGFDSPGFLGIALMGLGTANVTQSLQKLSNIKVVHSNMLRKASVGLSRGEVNLIKKEMVTKAMTVFPISQTGLAAVPLVVGGYTDRHVAQGLEAKSDVARSSLWIPMGSLGASALLTGYSAGWLPKLSTGVMSISKGLFGSYPAAFNNGADAVQENYEWLFGKQKHHLPSIDGLIDSRQPSVVTAAPAQPAAPQAEPVK